MREVRPLEAVLNQLLRKSELPSGLQVVSRVDFPEYWTRALSMASHCPVGATHAYLDYQLEYSSERNPHTVDFSFALHDGDAPFALVFGQATTEEGGERIEIGTRALPIQLAFLDTNPSKTVTRKIRDFLVSSLLHETVSKCCLQRPATDPLSDIDASLSQTFVCIDPIIRYVLDPVHSLDVGFSNFRKGHKSAVKSPKAKELEVSVVESDLVRIFSEFRSLHRNVSEQITRGEETWLLQLRALIKGDALLVQVRKSDSLVGGAYISTSRDEAIYGVGAYSRSLMKDGFPLGHVAQVEVIRHLASLGISRYVVGVQRDNANINESKLEGIDSFKRGFGAKLEVSLLFASSAN